MCRILAIGRRPKGSPISVDKMDDVDAKVSRLGSLIVARCDRPSDLVRLVAQHGQGQGRVAMLDVFDHGNSGTQRLGDDILFDSDGNKCSPLRGEEIALALRAHLADVAQIRLLGCLTATAPGDAGRLLLWKLARLLGGHRVIFGAIDEIDEWNFDADGFKVQHEISLLYSSLAALDGVAPTREARRLHIGKLSTEYCKRCVNPT